MQHDCKLIDGENLYLATGGMANVKYFNGGAAYSTDTYVLGTKENICPKFMYYVLLFLKQYIDINYFQGSGLKHLQKKDFKHYEIIIKESRISSPIQIRINSSVLRPNIPNHPILSVEQPRN